MLFPLKRQDTCLAELPFGDPVDGLLGHVRVSAKNADQVLGELLSPGGFQVSRHAVLVVLLVQHFDRRENRAGPELGLDALLDQLSTRGDELVNNAVKISLQRADELNRLYYRAQEVTGKPLDSSDFNLYLEKQENKGKFRTITEAGEAYLSPHIQAKTIADGIKEGVKAANAAESGKHVLGTTPGPATN